jgi:MFS family permease
LPRAHALTVISQGLGGIPFNALLKVIGPRYALSGTFIGVAVVVVASGCSSNIGAWYSLRLLLGLFEAGIFVGAAFVLSTWYTPTQLQFRLSAFYVGATSSGAVSGLLAYGLGQLDGVLGYRGWRWLYVVEGVLSFLVAVASIWLIQDAPEKRNKWLTEEQQRFVVLRGKYAYGSDKSGSSSDFTWKEFISAARSYHVWVLAFGYFTFCTAIYGFSLTMPTIIKNMGFTAAHAQALSIPPYIFATITLLICGWYADKYKRRMITCVSASSLGFM